jgi:ATP-dependent DNA helicase RecG
MATAMSSAARLRRVFELELERGAQNHAVIGGLDRMFIQMSEDGLLEAGGALRRQIGLLPSGGYRALTPEQRQAWLRLTIEALTREEAGVVMLPRRPRPTPTDAAPPPPMTPARKAAAPPPERVSSLRADSPVSKLPGVGKAGEARFARLGVATAGDAVYLFPRRFNDFSEIRTIAGLQPGSQVQTVVAEVFSIREMRYGRRVKGAEAVLQDRSGALRAVWFNKPYIARQLAEGQQVVVAGKVRLYRGRLQMENPEVEPIDPDVTAAGRLVPVYPATQGLSQRVLRRAVKEAVDQLAPLVPDPIPAWIRDQEGLSPAVHAIRALHYPESAGQAEDARRRLALGEFLAIQCAVLRVAAPRR